MIIITNRNIERRKKNTEKMFGEKFNVNGCNEIRLAEAKRTGKKWRVNIIAEPKDISNENRPSEKIFRDMQKTMKRKKRDCVFFIHGYNTSFEDVLVMSDFIEKNYKVEVVAFTWPSNGGGLNGIPSYKSDKRDAVSSIGALDRTLELMNKYLSNSDNKKNECGRSFNLLTHSMGNYLFKHLLKSSIYEGETLLFDNVILAAADVNNKMHDEWVSRIEYRRNLYICINENDSALGFSRAKFGRKQKARLGHFLANLNCKKAKYVDLTTARGVGKSHTYFVESVSNAKVKKFFKRAFCGKRAEAGLEWNAGQNTYIV